MTVDRIDPEDERDAWMVTRIRSVLERDGFSSNQAERLARLIVAALPREDSERHEHVAERKGSFTACMRCGEMPDHPNHEVKRHGHVFDHDLTAGLWTCECGFQTNSPDEIEAHREDAEQGPRP